MFCSRFVETPGFADFRCVIKMGFIYNGLLKLGFKQMDQRCVDKNEIINIHY